MPRQYFFTLSARKPGNPPREMGCKGFKTYRQANDAANQASDAIAANSYKLTRFIIGHDGGADGRVIDNDVTL